MNTYKAKQEARRERLLAAAERAEERSNKAYQQSNDIASHIPPGQPVLVGHHSERRHRRDLARIDRAMQQSVSEQDRAKELREKAAAVGRAGISSDDPDAIGKLTEKLLELEATRDAWKKENAAQRALGREASHPGYELTNIGSNIRRIKDRIRALEKMTTIKPSEKVVNGVIIVENPDINRVQLFFPGKPSAEVRKLLKSRGFRWAPSENAWQRMLTNGARYDAENIISSIQ